MHYKSNKTKSARPSVRKSKSINTTASRTTRSKWDTHSQSKLKNRSKINYKYKSKNSNIRPSIKSKQNLGASSIIMSRGLEAKTSSDFIKNKSKSFFTKFNKVKKPIIIILVACCVAAISICCGIFAFMSSTSGKISISDSAKATLIKPQENNPYYLLFTIDYDKEPDGNADCIMLVRADEAKKSYIICNIPVDTYVASTSGGGTTISNIIANKDDAAIINCISSFAEVGINYYVKMNSQSLCSLVDLCNGINVDLKEHIDDPTIGNSYISSGNSTLNGSETLTLLRATNFKGGSSTIWDNQLQVACGLAEAVMNTNNNSNFTASCLDKISDNLQTNLSTENCIKFVNNNKGINKDNFSTATTPGYNTLRNNEFVYIIDATKWKEIKTSISYGSLPKQEEEKTINDINPKSFTIHVRNGAGIDGAASMVANTLSSLGYNVVATDNAESTIYTDTLIIYNGDGHKFNAQAVKNSLNNGRIVDGSGLYDMDTDILIIIGSDLKI